jgi:hypothetical protein
MSLKGLLVVVLGMLIVACGGGNSNDESPTSPSGSGGSAPAAGAWTGTFARPGGQAPLSLRWEATANGSDLNGPLTLTNGAVSIRVPLRGSTSGNDRQGYDIHMSIMTNPGDIAGFPTCRVLGNTEGTPDPFSSPYTSITVRTFNISFSECSGFVENPPQRNGFQEIGQLSLRK